MHRKDGDETRECPCLFTEDFCTALDSTTLPIYIIDPASFTICYCNETMRAILGCNPVGQHCYKTIGWQDSPCHGCVAQKLYREGVSETTEYRTPRGQWLLMQVSPLNWHGRELYKLTGFDVTRRKELENELRLRNLEHAAFVSQSTRGVLRYDIATDTAAVNVNRELDRVEEYTINDYTRVIATSDLIVPESRAEAEAVLTDVRGGVPSRGYDLQMQLPRDGLRWIHVDYVLIDDEAGKPFRALVTFYDNTVQQEKELAYQNWNERLNALMDEYTAYMEVNLNQDRIEMEGRMGAWNQRMAKRRFSDFVALMSSKGIWEEDVFAFRRFFDRERLLGRFFAGDREAHLEYRALVNGAPQWYKAELQMVGVPSSGEVKASIVFSNVDVDKRERDRLTQEAERDALTGLYNRAAAEHLIQQVIGQNAGERCCFLMIDLDDLRIINSAFGHPEGDRALKTIGDAMQAQFRKSDILGRIGGDEFVVLLRNAPQDDDLRKILGRFIRRLNDICIGPNDDHPLHASIGGAVGVAGEVDFKTLYEHADLAMFYTKAMGKNAFHLYSPEMEKRTFSYRPRSGASLTSMEAYDTAEFQRMLQAVSSFFPMIISVNLTKNTYSMLEYTDYTMQRHADEGCFDQLVADGVKTFHPDDRESFLQCYKRENLLRAYDEGKRTIRHIGRQLGDDGVYRRTQTDVYLSKDEQTGDICEIVFSHVSYDEAERQA